MVDLAFEKGGPMMSHCAMRHKDAYPHCLISTQLLIAIVHQPLIFEDLMVEGTTENMHGYSFYSFGPMRIRGDLVLSCIVRRSDKT